MGRSYPFLVVALCLVSLTEVSTMSIMAEHIRELSKKLADMDIFDGFAARFKEIQANIQFNAAEVTTTEGPSRRPLPDDISFMLGMTHSQIRSKTPDELMQSLREGGFDTDYLKIVLQGNHTDIVHYTVEDIVYGVMAMMGGYNPNDYPYGEYDGEYDGDYMYGSSTPWGILTTDKDRSGAVPSSNLNGAWMDLFQANSNGKDKEEVPADETKVPVGDSTTSKQFTGDVSTNDAAMIMDNSSIPGEFLTTEKEVSGTAPTPETKSNIDQNGLLDLISSGTSDQIMNESVSTNKTSFNATTVPETEPDSSRTNDNILNNGGLFQKINSQSFQEQFGAIFKQFG